MNLMLATSGLETHDARFRPAAIRFVNLSKSYRLYDRPHERLMDQLGLNRLLFWKKQDTSSYHLFHALKDINLTVYKGERVGIIGRNGAGKTTLLKLVTQNFAPSAGEVEVHGTVQALMQLGIGFHLEFSGYENIKAALHYNGLIGDGFKEALQDVIDFVELGEFLHQPMKTYSLGMNARVQFAAATAIKPDILIIDEVLGAGDAYFAAKSALRMERLTRSGCTLLLVSHSWQMVQQFCERVIWLMDGLVHVDGVAHEVLAAYEAYVANETAKLDAAAAEPVEPPTRLIAADAAESSPAQSSASFSPAIESSTGAPAAEGNNYGTAVESSAAATPEGAARDGSVLESPSRVSERPAEASAEERAHPVVELLELNSDDERAETALPKSATIDWIAETLRQKEFIDQSDEHLDVLADGKQIYRVVGRKGLRFLTVVIRSGRKRAKLISTGDPLSFEISIEAQHSGHFAVSYWIHLFTIEGRRAARIRSQIDRFHLNQGERRTVFVKLDRTLLGAGEYLVSCSMFDQSTKSSTVDGSLRFEMLARSFQLTVASTNDSDPPVLHHPSVWFFGKESEGCDGELSPIV